MDFRYRAFVDVDDLAVGDCTVHRAAGGNGRWWQLWFVVDVPTRGRLAVAVPVNPGGDYTPIGPGGKTWGLARTSKSGVWHVKPSVNVLVSGTPHPGLLGGMVSLWHDWVRLSGVGEADTWTAGGPP